MKEYLTLKYKVTGNTFKLPKDKALEKIKNDRNYEFEIVEPGYDRKVAQTVKTSLYDKVVVKDESQKDDKKDNDQQDSEELIKLRAKLTEITGATATEEMGIDDIKSQIGTFLTEKYSALEPKELKEICTEKGIEFKSNTAKTVLVGKIVEGELKG